MPHTPVLWQQSSTYPAGADRQLLGALWPAGGALGAAVSAVANTMQVSIAPGSAAVALQSGQGSALCHWDTAEVLTLDASPPSGQSRVDLIVCQVRDPDLDGGLNSDFVLMAVKGTPAAFTADTRPGDKEGDELEAVPFAGAPPAVPPNALALASVTVPGAAANLNGAAITDIRPRMLGPAPTVKVIDPTQQKTVAIGGQFYPWASDFAFDFVAHTDRVLLSAEHYLYCSTTVSPFQAGFATTAGDINATNCHAVTLNNVTGENRRVRWEVVASDLTPGKLYQACSCMFGAFGGGAANLYYGGNGNGNDPASGTGSVILKAQSI